MQLQLLLIFINHPKAQTINAHLMIPYKQCKCKFFQYLPKNLTKKRMGQITNLCNKSKERYSQPISRISRLKKNPTKQDVPLQKLLFHEIADVFAYKYLRKGLYGTTVEVYVKQSKDQKFAQKIIPQENLIQNYICYEPMVVDKIMLDPVLKHKIVKVHAYSINNEKNKMYLIMDLMKKKDLYFHLCKVQKKNGRFFNQKAIKRIACELLQIVQSFHFHDLIFRNLRSENVFIKQNGKLAVSDFFFAINGPKCQTYYGAAQYAPPEVYYMEKSLLSMNQRMIRNLNQISDATDEMDLRMSPDLRRYKVNAKSSVPKLTQSCDLKDQIQQSKLKNKLSHGYQNQFEKVQKLSEKLIPIKMKRIDSKGSIPESKQQQISKSRLNNKNVATPKLPIKEAKDKQRNQTYTIPEQPYGQNSQAKQDALKVGHKSKVRFEDDKSDAEEEIDSNVSSMGFGMAYGKSVDFWMLGILLFELIFGRTPFEKWKGTCDVLSKTPVCPSYAENIKDLQYHVKNREIQQIWPKQNLQNNEPIVSQVEKSFIQNLLIRDPQKRTTIFELKKHQFLIDCDMKTPVEELIYEKLFESGSFEKEMKGLTKIRQSSLNANRTILKKTCRSNMAKARVTQKLFDHQKSVYEQ